MPNKIEFTLNDGYLQSGDNTIFNLILCKIKMLTADNCYIIQELGCYFNNPSSAKSLSFE